MKKSILGACALMFIIIVNPFISCKKSDNPTCTAGPGNLEIVIFALHNGDTIRNAYLHLDTAWVKYGTTTSPGADMSLYDRYYVTEGGEDHIHLTNLSCGSYYIYRTAFDSSTNTRYTGDLGISVTKTSGEVDTVIHVN